MLARVLAVPWSYVRPSVCLSHAGIVSKRLNVYRITQTAPCESQETLVFWHRQSLVGDDHSPWNLRSNWPTPFEHNNFDHYPLIAPQPWDLEKEVQLLPRGSRQCAFHRAIDEPCALPLSPQRLAQNENFYILRCLL